MEEFGEKLTSIFTYIPKKLYIPIGLGLCGMILLGIGSMQYLVVKKNQEVVVDESSISVSTPAPMPSLVVDIEGAVIKPGVYKMLRTARLQDVLIMAGGLSSNADRDFVAKQVNLASKVTDGEKVYIPKVGEIPTGGFGSTQNGQAGVLGINTSGLININSATETELDSLPGVGPVTAQKIIKGRPYTSAEDLLSKKVISQSIYTKIKEKITSN